MSKVINQCLKRITGESMSIKTELAELNAPRNVRDAGNEIQKSLDAGLRPPYGLVTYVERWVSRQREQNRWGK